MYAVASPASDMKRTYAGPKTGNHEVDAKLLATLADDTRSYMPPTDARRPRSAVARVVCVAQDRPDLDVVACIVAKTMAHPKIGN